MKKDTIKREIFKRQITKVIIDGKDAMIYYLDGKKIRILERTIDDINISKTESHVDVVETEIPITRNKKRIDFQFGNIEVNLKDIQYK
ncbi:hypothetical protein [Bacillus cereus group sp. TH152-1LC]|uniref:hypothetical protein n=1 Tax=Bacillus cereus group sp. TH152-1LC TaxID=3018060 RepID=UPI0022E90DAE|nr:hypothetical protein [Bacillus cereus group sp. TH152-1LC]MDA1675318.1 hypothetical protein [Bacillus cereus group sp. TH152-1LC]